MAKSKKPKKELKSTKVEYSKCDILLQDMITTKKMYNNVINSINTIGKSLSEIIDNQEETISHLKKSGVFRENLL